MNLPCTESASRAVTLSGHRAGPAESVVCRESGRDRRDACLTRQATVSTRRIEVPAFEHLQHTGRPAWALLHSSQDEHLVATGAVLQRAEAVG
jgi:hypothetical protein